MDELNSSFGKLSTSAAEWRPRGAAAPAATARSSSGAHPTAPPLSPRSDLKASSVKEFVPGRAWTRENPAAPSNDTTALAPLGSRSEDSYDHSHQAAAYHHHHHHRATVEAAGPTSSELPSLRAIQSMGLPDDLWRFYRGLSLESTRQMDPSDARHKAVPLPYCNAYCLDDDNNNNNAQQQQQQQQSRRSSCFGYPSTTFQVTSREDGNLYCLRRFDSVRSVSPKIALAVSDRWASSAAVVMQHPGVVPFYQCFVAQRAVFFVHQFCVGSRTLQERIRAGPLTEPALWSCICQLVSAIRTIHGNGLAVRSLRLQNVLSVSDSMGSRLRLRINCLGVVDALEFEARKHVADLQEQDVRDLGWVILSLATGSEATRQTTPDATSLGRLEAFLVQNYSPELRNLTMTLIRSGGGHTHTRPTPTIMDIARTLALRSMDEQDEAYRALDRTERSLAAEYDSGRVLRLLFKLGFVNERPEFGPNRRWAQSGDCYVLTLFRDYVFHQADAGGNPVMDLGHVVMALNKLDAADEERIVLSSRDGKSLMVVSYADVARCLESAFHELCAGSVPTSALQY